MGKKRDEKVTSTAITAESKSCSPFPSALLNDYVNCRRVAEFEEVFEGIFVADNVIPASVCKEIIRSFGPLLEPTNPRNLKPKKGYAFRNNDRCLQVRPDIAADLFSIIQPGLEALSSSFDRIAPGRPPIQLSSDIRVYHYGKGQSFGPHVDEPVLSPCGTMVSEFTLLLYLTGGPKDDQSPPLRGGETRFQLGGKRNPADIDPALGRVCLHWTGHDCLHEGCAVTSGHKYILRTDVFHAKP